MKKQRTGGMAGRSRLLLAAGCALFAAALAAGLLASCKSMTASNKTLVELLASGEIDELKDRLLNGDSINQVNEDGQTLLHIAALQDNGEIITFLLAFGPDTEIKDNDGRTPFALAAENACWNAAKSLAAGGAYLFAENPEGATVYDSAAAAGVEGVQAVICKNTADQQDGNGRTPLHIAAINLDADAAAIIVESAEHFSARDADGKTPLMYAYESPNSEAAAQTAALLLLAGAEPTHGDFSYFETAVLKRNLSMRFGEGETPLHIAASKGSCGFVQYLINRGAQVNAKDGSSSTPLHEAVIAGSTDCAQMLIKAGADVNAQNASGNTALHLVMPLDARETLFDALLSAGADPNLKDIYGETPLHIAARIAMSREIIEKLVGAGADLNERNKRGMTPLALAIEREQAQQAAIFVSLGADIHAEDFDKGTALTMAVDKGLDMTRAVLVRENVHSRDGAGSTPLHIAVAKQASPAIIEHVLSLGADVNARDKRGNTALHAAVENNWPQIGELLLGAGADVFTANVAGNSVLKIALTRLGGREDWVLTSNVVNSRDGAGNTPLHLAAEWNLAKAIPLIIEKGGEINAKNYNGETPLFNAAKANSPEMIKALLAGAGGSSNADLNARNFLGNSALFSSITWRASKSASTLIEADASSNGKELLNAKNLAGKTPLHEAARIGDKDLLALILRAGADVNAADEIGATPLVDAVNTGSADTARALLEYGAVPIIQDMYGRNAFHAAAEGADVEIIAMLRKAGASPMSRDAYGTTPLSLAFSRGDDVIKAVLGAGTSIADSDGNTPLHLAVSEGAGSGILSMLIEQGYPVNSRNRSGKTALSVALEKDDETSMRILLQAGCDPFITDSEGNSVAGIILSEKIEHVALLTEYAADETDAIGDGLLHYAARLSSPGIVMQLRNTRLVDPYAKNIEGETPADIAARWSRPDIQALLK